MDYASAVLADNPVAYWRFNETAGTTAVNSGSLGAAANGIYQPGTTLNQASLNSTFGTAVDFNGSSGFVQTVAPAALGLGGSFTASAWVRLDALNNDRTVFGTDSTGTNVGLHLLASRNNNPHMGFYANDTGSPNPVTTGQWMHLAWRYDAAKQEQSIWVNGKLDTVEYGHGNFNAAGASTLLLGRWNGGSYLDGLMDEVAIFNTALSSTRIAAQYAAAVGPNSVNDTGTVNENGTLTVAGPGVLANDGPQPAVVVGNSTPSAGTVTVNPNGGYTYNPNGAFESLAFNTTGTATFTYNVLTAAGLPLNTTLYLAPTGPNGTYHAYLRDGGSRTWDEARVAATGLTFQGVTGHLATVSSYAENQLLTLIRNSMGGSDLWLGSTDKGPANGVGAPITSLIDGQVPAPGAGEFGNTSGTPNVLGATPASIAGTQRGEGWAWVTGEPMIYSNWAGGEPNGGAGESAMQLRADGLWNDLPVGNSFSTANEGTSALGSLIEFDLNLTAAQLAAMGATPGFSITVMNASDGSISNGQARNPFSSYIRDADAIVEGPQTAGFPASVSHNLADVTDAGASGQFAGGTQLPGVNNAEQYVSVTKGVLNVNTAGTYTFAFSADDGGRLRIDVNGDGQLEDVLIADTTATTVEMQVPIFLTAGQHAFDWMWFEIGGGAFGELGYRLGSANGFNSTNYKLVGDGSGGIGTVGQLTTTVYKADQTNFNLNNLADTDNLLNGVTQRGGVGVGRAIVPTINFINTGGGPQFGGDVAVPYMNAINTDNDQYAIEATGMVYIPTAGTWTFDFNSDDGFRVAFGGGATFVTGFNTNSNGDPLLNVVGGNNFAYNAGRGTADTLGQFNFPTAGFYPITIRAWEGGGGSAFEFSAAQGAQTSFNASTFRLVGDTANGGLLVMSSGNANASATVTVTVVGENDQATAVIAGSPTVAEGGTVTLSSAGSSDPDTGETATLQYFWDLDGDGIFGEASTANGPENVANPAFVAAGNVEGPGNYEVQLYVRDAQGLDSAIVTKTIVVTNSPPEVSISGPSTGVIGQALTFQFDALDPSDVDTAADFTWTWSFGEPGQTADDRTNVVGMTPQTATHAYSSEGTYTITVTATDKDGAVSLAATFEVVVGFVMQDETTGDVIFAGSNTGADKIVVSPLAGDGVQVQHTLGSVVNRYRFFFGDYESEPGTARVIIYGNGGADDIRVSGTFTRTVEFHGGEGNDYLAGGAGNDSLYGDNGTDRLLGGLGGDLMEGGNGNDSMDGGAGNDTLYGGADTDTVVGGAGDDLIFGGNGIDRTLNGGDGDDIIFGEGPNDSQNLVAESMTDSANTLSGGNGNDVLVGGKANDVLNGLAGNDILIGGLGLDSLNGGNNEDILIAGETIYDTGKIEDDGAGGWQNDANLDALFSIRNDWNDGSLYLDRVDNIRGTYFSSGEITHDALKDTLTGAGSTDWFLAQITDKVDRVSGEKLN